MLVSGLHRPSARIGETLAKDTWQAMVPPVRILFINFNSPDLASIQRNYHRGISFFFVGPTFVGNEDEVSDPDVFFWGLSMDKQGRCKIMNLFWGMFLKGGV